MNFNVRQKRAQNHPLKNFGQIFDQNVKDLSILNFRIIMGVKIWTSSTSFSKDATLCGELLRLISIGDFNKSCYRKSRLVLL